MTVVLEKKGVRNAPPVLTETFKQAKEGIQHLDLASKNIKLEAGAEYKYTIKLSGSDHPENEVHATAGIKRVQPDAQLSATW